MRKTYDIQVFLKTESGFSVHQIWQGNSLISAIVIFWYTNLDFDQVTLSVSQKAK